MSETPVRFGILGCATIARMLSRAIRLAPNASISAIGSRSIDKASKFASENGFPASAKVYGSYEAVLDDPEVDAVYVPPPTSLHLKWAVLAAEKKKKHLLLEKPVALDVKELDTILEACESNGVQFMDATMWMHHPRTAKMKEFLSDPRRFGQLKLIRKFSKEKETQYAKTQIPTKWEVVKKKGRDGGQGSTPLINKERETQSSIPSTSNAFDVLGDMGELGNGDSSQELRNRGSPSPSDPSYGETSKEDNRRKLKAKLHDLKNARRKF